MQKKSLRPLRKVENYTDLLNFSNLVNLNSLIIKRIKFIKSLSFSKLGFSEWPQVLTIFGRISLNKTHPLCLSVHKTFKMTAYVQALVCLLAQHVVFEGASSLH